VTSDPTEDLPATLTLDEAYRAAFYLVRDYVALESHPDEGLALLLQYLWTDPARWGDWTTAVRAALADDGLADPDHEGLWRLRPDMPI
jgi:hypothetical protein